MSFYESWGEYDVDCEHSDMLKAASARLVDPLVGFFWKAGAEVVEGAFSASIVEPPEHSA